MSQTKNKFYAVILILSVISLPLRLFASPDTMPCKDLAEQMTASHVDKLNGYIHDDVTIFSQLTNKASYWFYGTEYTFLVEVRSYAKGVSHYQVTEWGQNDQCSISGLRIVPVTADSFGKVGI